MDGLECSEVLLSVTLKNKDWRIDSPFYTTKIYRNPSLRYEPIGKHLLKTEYGFSREMNEDGVGYQIFRMNELHDMLCDIAAHKYVAATPWEFSKLKLNDGDILFNRTNSYEFVGRTGIYYDTGVLQTFASYLVRLIPDRKTILPEYLTAFLNSSYGIREIKRRARQSINQTNVNPEEVKAIELPLVSMDFQENIKRCFMTAHRARVDADRAYSAAERLLLSALDCPPITQSENYTVKSFSKSFGATGRLDAEYYQPKYDKLFQLLSALPTKRLKSIVNITKSIEPGSEYYGDVGVPFIRVSDVSKYQINVPAIRIPKTTVPSIENLYPKKDTILFSKDGSVGIAYKMEDDMEAVTSNALLHLTVKDTTEVLPDYLTLLLNSDIVRLQAERDVSGAIIQHWKPSDIEWVVVPILPLKMQRQIAEKIEESFFLRRQSQQLLESAKHAVEMAIEQSETAAMAWLQAQK